MNEVKKSLISSDSWLSNAVAEEFDLTIPASNQFFILKVLGKEE